MANLFGTGFEGITSATATRRLGSSPNAITASGRFGQGMSVSGGAVGFPIIPSGMTVFVGVAVLQPTTANTDMIYIRGATLANHVLVRRVHATNTLEVVGPTGTVLISAAGAMSFNTWTYVELKVFVDDSTGSVELRVNNVSVGTASSVDTKSVDSAIANVLLAQTAGGTTSTYDDFYINDDSGSAPHNTFYGDVRFDRVDTAANSTVQFTPSASTNESCIDDGNSIDDDTTYNQSSTAGHKDSFTVSGYTAPSGVILGVFVRSVVRKTDAGARTFNNFVTSGATTVESTPVALSTSYIEHTQALYTDPDTGVAWANAAAINAMLIGYEIDT